MVEPGLPASAVAALRAGGEALDRGERGPGPELDILRDIGLLMAPLPVSDGGRGSGTQPAGADAMLEVLATLGGANLAIARLYEGHVNAIKLIVRFGSDTQRRELAQAVVKGTMLGVWGADSEAPVMIDPDTSLLRGTKAFASGLGDLGLVVLTARSENGLRMILADANDPARADLAAWDVDGMVGSRSGRFRCDGLPAGEDRLLGGADALFVEPDFHGGLWRLAACYAGAMQRIARLIAELLDRRGTLDAPLMRARLGTIAVEAEGARLWASAAAAAVEGGTTTSALAVQTALFAREAIEHGAIRMLGTVERIAGTAMHRRDSELGRLARDLRFYLRQADLDGKLALATGHWINR